MAFFPVFDQHFFLRQEFRFLLKKSWELHIIKCITQIFQGLLLQTKKKHTVGSKQEAKKWERQHSGYEDEPKKDTAVKKKHSSVQIPSSVLRSIVVA